MTQRTGLAALPGKLWVPGVSKFTLQTALCFAPQPPRRPRPASRPARGESVCNRGGISGILGRGWGFLTEILRPRRVFGESWHWGGLWCGIKSAAVWSFPRSTRPRYFLGQAFWRFPEACEIFHKLPLPGQACRRLILIPHSLWPPLQSNVPS